MYGSNGLKARWKNEKHYDSGFAPEESYEILKIEKGDFYAL